MPCPDCGYAPERGKGNVRVLIAKEGGAYVIRCFECDSSFERIPYDEFYDTSKQTIRGKEN